jgi:ADP-heptose:LPS heptosyltransferase
LAAAHEQLGIDVHWDREIDPLASLDDLATQVAAMDLVVSIDNSTVHMAGALGVPVWVMLPKVPDWRWLLDREDSVWYASARLFRQERRADWVAVITAVAAELRRLVAAGSRLASPGRGCRN